VLDVGAGAGHWVDFYRTALGAGDVVGLEISPPAAEQLGAHYAGDPRVSIVRGDVTDEAFAIDRRFDVINAVDVLFHIVADDRWQRALRNLAALLAPGGRVVIVEHVGLVSHDAGLRRPSTARGDRAGLDPERPAIVTKRVRSLREWRSGAGDAGLELFDSVRLRKRRTLATPANRMLAFRQVEA
jgi:SAM-dependent methyltransferase